jgi:Pregnancy-associated plasma protein-A
MFPLSFTASTFLGVLLALKSIENVISCPSHHGAKELDGPPVAGCADESRRLQDVEYICLAPPATPGQVQAVAAAVEQFYEGQPPGTRRLQDTIAVDVNFIVVRTTDNRGSTQGHAKAQIDFLNLTFLPDFKFNLKTNKVVVNDDYFTKVKSTPAVESEMKKAHRIGGMETLNVYAVEMNSGIVGGSTFPFTNEGNNDGIVLNYQAMPRGGDAYYSEGDVSIEHEGLLASCRHVSRISHFRAIHFSCQGLIHLVGHWLGLFHTFEGGCSTPNDGINDTPAEQTGFFNCDNPKRDSCPALPGLDSVYNYMTFAPDSCLDNFTKGQRNAMRANWFIYREAVAAPPAPVPVAPAPVPVKTTMAPTKNVPVGVPVGVPVAGMKMMMMMN